MLMMLVDRMTKYAGCQLKCPEVPEVAKTTLSQLTQSFPDGDKIEGSETDTGYTVKLRPYKSHTETRETKGRLYDVPRKNNEKWLQDFYYQYCRYLRK
jgi:hypothetical protein